jgi:hypothetical protein
MLLDKNITHPWAEPKDRILKARQVAGDEGPDKEQARNCRRRFGANRIKPQKRRSTVSILLDQVKNLIVLLSATCILMLARVFKLTPPGVNV